MYEEIMKEFKTFREQVYAKFADGAWDYKQAYVYVVENLEAIR